MPHGQVLASPGTCRGAALALPVGTGLASRLGGGVPRPHRGRGFMRPWIATALLLSFPAPAMQPSGLPEDRFSDPSFIAAIQLPGMVWRRPVSQPAASPLPRSAADSMTDRYLDWQAGNYAGVEYAVLRLSRERLPGPIATPSRKQIERWVRKLAPQYELEAELVLSVIAQESAFNPRARSSKNAHGLMQLIPSTARRFGVKNIYDPVENLKGGMAYLRWLMRTFKGNVELVLAGYNAGEGAVRRFGGIPPYKETRTYVARITRSYKKKHHPVPTSAPEARVQSRDS